MAEPFLAEIRLMSFIFPPRGWALCNGQLLPINQNQALFSLLGTTYGGDGRVNFGLPDLRSRVPIHMGNGFTQGQRGGTESETLSLSHMPAHSHSLNASTAPATLTSPLGNVLAQHAVSIYGAGTGGGAVLNAATVGTSVGGSQPHENRQPSLVISFCIALQGIFPSQN